MYTTLCYVEGYCLNACGINPETNLIYCINRPQSNDNLVTGSYTSQTPQNSNMAKHHPGSLSVPLRWSDLSVPRCGWTVSWMWRKWNVIHNLETSAMLMQWKDARWTGRIWFRYKMQRPTLDIFNMWGTSWPWSRRGRQRISFFVEHGCPPGPPTFLLPPDLNHSRTSPLSPARPARPQL